MTSETQPRKLRNGVAEVPTAYLPRQGSAAIENGPPSAPDHYWPAIDGLRAIAIGLVVAFHAGVPQLGGGFVGVDVFFVLSGYLITGLLMREIERTGGIDLVDFYARRARRLLPALAVVILATLMLGAIFLTPAGEQQGLGRSAIAASAFLANIYFWRTQSSYFAGPSEQLPLLNLWTLSVEEQFYIVWPLAMIAAAVPLRKRPRVALRVIATMLAVGSATSLMASWRFTTSHGTLAFYTLPFRAWEFGVGAMLALVPLTPGRGALTTSLGIALTGGGIAAIAAAGVLFDSSTAFPGIAAALPVLGAAAAIAGVRMASDTLPARLLATAPMVGIGKLSYSWYLWHWPLLALARADAMGAHSAWRDGLLVLLALGLSALTFRFVEQPVRHRRPWPFARRWPSVTAGLLLMGCTGTLGGLLWWQAETRAAASLTLRPVMTALTERVALPLECTQFGLPFAGLAPAPNCMLGSRQSGPLVLLWGDSHAHHLIPGLETWAMDRGGRLLPRTMGACLPTVASLPDRRPSGQLVADRSCVDFNRSVLDSLPALKTGGLAAVVIAARWSLETNQIESPATLLADLQRLVDKIRGLGLPVLIVADGPGFAHSVPQCIARRGKDGCALPRARVDQQHAGTRAGLHRIAAADSAIRLVEMIDALCSASTCPVARDGIVLYSDHSHVSVAASRTLTPFLDAALTPLLARHP